MEKYKINDAVMENVEILSKLKLEPEEREAVREKLQEILTYMDKLNELDTEEVEPLFHTIPFENVFRPDMVTNQDAREAMLLNAPDKKEGQYQVPKTV